MVFLLLISLYTSRVVLKYLGVVDYGIHNLIGGIVVLFYFICNSSAAGTQRFLNFAIGEDNYQKANQIYSSSVIIHFVVAVLFFILSEIAGLWCVNYYLNIPEQRLIAANWVLQLSLVSVVIGIIKIPYNAAIIAHEKMSFYALISIFDGICKLVIAFLIAVFQYDKLILYSALSLIVSIISFFITKVYVNKKFSICRFVFHKEKNVYKDLVSFSGWSLLSSVGSTCSNHVLTFILNKFFGVVANAAMGIANSVNNAVFQLISNFQVAFEPQITKSYAANEKEYLIDLIFKTSKFSFLLLWFFVLPLGINVHGVLNFWLVEVPDNTDIFLVIILIYSLIEALIGPLWMVSYAIGNIRNYQIVAFCIPIMTIPILWMLFKMGMPPYWIVIIRVLSNLLFSFWRMGYLKKRMKFPVLKYVQAVLLPVFIITFFSFIVSYISYIITDGLIQFFVSCTVSVVINVVGIWLIGCNKEERVYLKNAITNVIKRN